MAQNIFRGWREALIPSAWDERFASSAEYTLGHVPTNSPFGTKQALMKAEMNLVLIKLLHKPGGVHHRIREPSNLFVQSRHAPMS
jgi:hypothetical protein